NGSPVFLQPGDEFPRGSQQLCTERRKPVFHARWDLRMKLSRYQAVSLEVSQCRGQHPLGHARKRSFQFRKSNGQARLLAKQREYGEAPPVTESSESVEKFAAARSIDRSSHLTLLT